MYRITKKGGFIYLVDLDRNVERKFIKNTIKDLSKRSLSHTIFYLMSLKASYTLPEVKNLLERAEIKEYDLINNKNNSLKQKLMSVDLAREKKDLLFRERWEVIIKKDLLFRERWAIVIKK